MGKKYFDRRTIVDGDVFQIWKRAAGDNWGKRVHHDEFHEQYGPYAWH